MTYEEAKKLALELEGVITDVMEGDGFDDVCLKTIAYVRDCLQAIEQAQKQEPVAGQPLPCPFCGHVGLDFSDGNTYRWGIASCGGCGASRGDIRREYPDEGKWHSEAIAEWNKRTAPPPRQPLTDGLTEIIRSFGYTTWGQSIEIADAIEAKLKEKNT